MEVFLNSIDGIDQAFTALTMSKRNYSREKEVQNKIIVLDSIDQVGFASNETETYKAMMSKIIKYGVDYGHGTLLSFIDLRFTVTGIHRAAQDDFDSHAKRLDNRIVRSSTRLATFEAAEKSDWYKGKILTTEDALKHMDVNMPVGMNVDGINYVWVGCGYVAEGMESDKDVLRGLYRECIPSDFTFACNLQQFAHIYKMRNRDSTAAPELKMAVEMMADRIEEYQPMITREVLMRICQ